MYMMKWNVAQARARFSELLRAAAQEPQVIYKRDHPVAAVVDPDSFQEFAEWQARQVEPSIADAFDKLRVLCQEEGWSLEIDRRDRPNPFAEESSVLSG